MAGNQALLTDEEKRAVAFLLEQWRQPFRITTIQQALHALGLSFHPDARLSVGRYLAANPGIDEKVERWGIALLGGIAAGPFLADNAGIRPLLGVFRRRAAHRPASAEAGGQWLAGSASTVSRNARGARRLMRNLFFSPLAEAGSIGGLGALAGVACCGPFFVGWLAQLVFAGGGVAGLYFLVQYEAPILLSVAVLSGLAGRFGADPYRGVSWSLGGLALLFAATRILWDLNYEVVMAVPLAYWPFVYRQPIFATAALLALGLRLALLVKWPRPCSIIEESAINQRPAV